MAVPGEDVRDFEFAEKFGLPVVRTVQPPEGFDGGVPGAGPMINSANDEVSLNGLDKATAITDWLVEHGHGEATTTYKLRDWLFSRQRYWGEPFPIVYDENDLPIAVPSRCCRCCCPRWTTTRRRRSPTTTPTPPRSRRCRAPPSGRRSSWTWATGPAVPPRDQHDAQLGRLVLVLPALPGPGRRRADGRPGAGAVLAGPALTRRRRRRRPVRRRCRARRPAPAVRPVLAQGAARPGHVSSEEPFRRLVNQGYISAYAYTDERGFYVPAEVVEKDGSVLPTRASRSTASTGRSARA